MVVEKIQRISGATRYETNVNIAKEVIKETSTQAIFVRGDDFLDAIAVATYAAMFRQPVLLTKNDESPNEVLAFFNASILW
ncbi:cell wall-binding repeat-containing protein [Rossellomorea sp. AcN35-11]|nr:cell wall-binding repeat-containing protein [Rossellomorea aquimaris]WJV31395.1 cell wall-binding repeat-containing protein [Rossellomorea sp. AcN35-11]